MTALEFIKLKQKSWAERKGFTLLPGTIANEDGDEIYFEKIDDNIYEKLSPNNKNFFKKGQGNETDDNCIRRAKMKSAVSSSAIAVNLFQYWQKKEDISPLLKALRIIRKNNRTTTNATIKFEDKKEIINPKTSETISTPNLDITIKSKNLQYITAIESKFTEPYSSKTQKELAEKYNNENLWVGLENIKNEIYKLENEKKEKIFKFKRLDYLQLIKHILGLKSKHGKKFKLLYLWYDVPGTEGYEHRQEIEAFASIAKADGINFRHITYQEVIFYLKENHYAEHKNYIDYLVERYL